MYISVSLLSLRHYYDFVRIFNVIFAAFFLFFSYSFSRFVVFLISYFSFRFFLVHQVKLKV